MKNYKFLLLFLLATTLSGFAQNKSSAKKSLVINVLIDADKKIYIEEYITPKGDITRGIQKIIRTTPSNKYQGVTYRIFADGSLQHGIIMDINQLLLVASQPINTKTEKYLLDLKDNDLDGLDWTKQLKKLDLKAIKVN